MSLALAVVAAIGLWTVLHLLLLSGLAQARAQHDLQAELREAIAGETAPLGAAEPGTPVALLSIPTLGLRQVVVEGTAPSDLQSGPGHRRDTVLPGQAGVAIVYGRAAAYGAPFAAVPTLRAGDGIAVATAQGEAVYRVDGVRRDGDPLPDPPAPGTGRLTLVTAEGSGPLAAVTPDRTVYVDATLVGEAATPPGGRPAAVPDAERALGTDAGVLPVLALCLQGLVLGAAAVTIALRRLPSRTVWALGLPVLAALAWLTSDAAAQLLPNLL